MVRSLQIGVLINGHTGTAAVKLRSRLCEADVADDVHRGRTRDPRSALELLV